MCGIAGFFIKNPDWISPARAQSLISEMTQTLVYRGPDDAGTHQSDQVYFGFRRLSILDLSPAGHQPMVDGDYSLVCNGEIYNFKELRKTLVDKGYSFKSQTDVEVVLKAYQEWGDRFIDHLDGMFAFAIYDRKQKKIILARDRLGIKPLYYIDTPDFFAFASELKALLKIPGIQKKVNVSALWQYLTWMQVPAPLTIFENFRKLQPAHQLEVIHHQTILKEYWSPRFEEDFSKTEIQHQELLEERLTNATKTHLVADVEVGSYLSGGLDSSFISAMTSLQKNDLKTFSVSFDSRPEFDEARFQKMVADKIKTQHFTQKASKNLSTLTPSLIRESDEPFAIASALPLLEVSKLAQQHVKVVLSGDGADELLGGYAFRYLSSQRIDALYKKIHFKESFRRVNAILSKSGLAPRSLLRFFELGALTPEDRYSLRANDTFSPELKLELLSLDYRHQLEASFEDPHQKIWKTAPPSGINRHLYFELKTSLADEMLTKADRCSSMVSLEARVPFLDLSVVECATRIPLKYKFDRNGGKKILKSIAQKYIPGEILTRPKWGFNVPLEDYLGNLTQLRRARLVGINSTVKNRLIDEHVNKYQDHTKKLWILAVYHEFLAQQGLNEVKL